MPPLELLHVDDACIVAVKPAGLLSVPGRGADKADCLITRVQAQYPDALIVHRLDQATSGLMVLARGKDNERHLSKQFQARTVGKHYVALVQGAMAHDTGEIELPLIADWPNRPLQKVDHAVGKPSHTRYEVLVRDGATNTTRLQLTPYTGRTHQLRVHLMAIGHPIVGDALYGGRPAPRLMLHAAFLQFRHPQNGDMLRFDSPTDFDAHVNSPNALAVPSPAPDPLPAALAQIEAMQRELAARNLTHRPPPPVPTSCCGRGCNGCVWEGYFAAVSYWLEQAQSMR